MTNKDKEIARLKKLLEERKEIYEKYSRPRNLRKMLEVNNQLAFLIQDKIVETKEEKIINRQLRRRNADEIYSGERLQKRKLSGWNMTKFEGFKK